MVFIGGIGRSTGPRQRIPVCSFPPPNKACSFTLPCTAMSTQQQRRKPCINIATTASTVQNSAQQCTRPKGNPVRGVHCAPSSNGTGGGGIERSRAGSVTALHCTDTTGLCSATRGKKSARRLGWVVEKTIIDIRGCTRAWRSITVFRVPLEHCKNQCRAVPRDVVQKCGNLAPSSGPQGPGEAIPEDTSRSNVVCLPAFRRGLKPLLLHPLLLQYANLACDTAVLCPRMGVMSALHHRYN